MKDPIDIKKANAEFDAAINELLRYRCMEGDVNDYIIITIIYTIEKGRYRICFKNAKSLSSGFMDECLMLFKKHYPKPFYRIDHGYADCNPCEPLES